MTYLPSNHLVRFICLTTPSIYVFLAPSLHIHLPYEPVSTKTCHIDIPRPECPCTKIEKSDTRRPRRCRGYTSLCKNVILPPYNIPHQIQCFTAIWRMLIFGGEGGAMQHARMGHQTKFFFPWSQQHSISWLLLKKISLHLRPCYFLLLSIQTNFEV